MQDTPLYTFILAAGFFYSILNLDILQLYGKHKPSKAKQIPYVFLSNLKDDLVR